MDNRKRNHALQAIWHLDCDLPSRPIQSARYSVRFRVLTRQDRRSPLSPIRCDGLGRPRWATLCASAHRPLEVHVPAASKSSMRRLRSPRRCGRTGLARHSWLVAWPARVRWRCERFGWPTNARRRVKLGVRDDSWSKSPSQRQEVPSCRSPSLCHRDCGVRSW